MKDFLKTMDEEEDNLVDFKPSKPPPPEPEQTEDNSMGILFDYLNIAFPLEYKYNQ